MSTPTTIRKHSLKIMAAKELVLPPILPLIDMANSRRTAEETVSRMLAMHAVAACSYGFNRDEASRWLHRENLDSFLIEDERSYIESHQSKDYRIYPEALYAFCWVLGFIPSLNSWAKCPENLVTLLPDLRKHESSEKWLRKASHRSNNELLENLDLAYCFDWAVREKLDGINNVLETDEAAVKLRRLVLEWIFSDEDWDKINLDT